MKQVPQVSIETSVEQGQKQEVHQQVSALVRQLHGILKLGYLSACGVVLCLAAHSQFVYSAGERDQEVSTIFSSPVQIHATWENMEPYDNDELAYVVQRVAHLAGTDDHGYQFPGAIDEVLALNPALNVSCSWDTMSVQPGDDRWTTLNPHEETFIHSADPASLRVVPTGDGRVYIVFRDDGRALPYSPYDPPIGVDRYLVEWASAPEGPFNLLQEVESQAFIHVVEDPGYLPNRYYRVRTVFADQTTNSYSWVASADHALDAHFGYASLLWDGSMYAACIGAGCPADPTEVVIEADRNHSRTIDSVCSDINGDGAPDEPARCERWHFTNATPIGNGFMYNGTFAKIDDYYDYRVVLENEPSVTIPSGNERYQVFGNNNRIHVYTFGNYLLWPDDQRYQTQTQRRLADCLDLGYTGMRLDYALADISPSWISSGLPPDWNTGGEQRLRDGVVSQLTELRNSAPDANITFNGYFATTHPLSYFTQLEPITGGEFEWFAFGNTPGATEVDLSVYGALGAMVQSASMGKWAVAQVGGLGPNGPENHDARRKSLALYLLVADEHNYYYYVTSGIYAALEYYPEWNLPLGNPTLPLLEMTANDFAPFEIEGLIGREFENGWTLFNTSTDPVTIHFDEPVYEVVLVGGRVPELGGDGALDYKERTEILLNGRDGALVLKSAP